jgi:hypothetical protein
MIVQSSAGVGGAGSARQVTRQESHLTALGFAVCGVGGHSRGTAPLASLQSPEFYR